MEPLAAKAWSVRPAPLAALLAAEDGDELAVEGRGGQLAELVGGEGAVGTDEEGVGEPDVAPGGGAPVGVHADGPAAAVLADERVGGVGLVLDEDADDGEAVGPVAGGGAGEQRELAHARFAPGGPEVDHDGAAAEGGQVEPAAVEGAEPQGRRGRAGRVGLDGG